MDTQKTPGAYVAPKSWDDISSDEKIERLRQIIKDLQRQVSRTHIEINSVKTNFKKHEHGEKGLLVPYDEYASNGNLGSATENSLSNNFF